MSTNTATIAVPAQALRRHSIIRLPPPSAAGPTGWRRRAPAPSRLPPCPPPSGRAGKPSCVAEAAPRRGIVGSTEVAADARPLRAEALVHRNPDADCQRRRGPTDLAGCVHRRGRGGGGCGRRGRRAGCWPLAAVFMVLRLAGANLDGAVARAAERSRPWASSSTKSATAPRMCWPSRARGVGGAAGRPRHALAVLAGDHGAAGGAGVDATHLRGAGRGGRQGRRGPTVARWARPNVACSLSSPAHSRSSCRWCRCR